MRNVDRTEVNCGPHSVTWDPTNPRSPTLLEKHCSQTIVTDELSWQELAAVDSVIVC